MKNNSYMTIKEFSKITGIKRENLRYYNSINLLIPEFRGDNGYRYYSREQVNTAYLISSLREIGIGIEDIKNYINIRTPEKMFSLFKIQKKNISEEIKKLQNILEIMNLYTDLAEDALKYEENSIIIQDKKKEPIFLGPDINSNYSTDPFITFYNFVIEKGINSGYPIGVLTNNKSLDSNSPPKIMNFYFRTESQSNSYKPAGRYLTLYGKSSYEDSYKLYEKLYSYIKENNLKVHDYIYEEYPLNEISILNDNDFCVKLEVMLKES